MTETKSAAASTGVWGSLTAVLGAATPLIIHWLGLTSAEQQTALTCAGQAVAAVGGAVALIGRLKATKRVA